MEFCQVNLEGHAHGATIYISGWLADLAATRAERVVASLRRGTLTVRVDLRGVEIIDPTAFVRVARALSRWRDVTRGRVLIEFPERSAGATRSSCALPERPHLARHVLPLTLRPAISSAPNMAPPP